MECRKKFSLRKFQRKRAKQKSKLHSSKQLLKLPSKLLQVVDDVVEEMEVAGEEMEVVEEGEAEGEGEGNVELYNRHLCLVLDLETELTGVAVGSLVCLQLPRHMHPALLFVSSKSPELTEAVLKT